MPTTPTRQLALSPSDVLTDPGPPYVSAELSYAMVLGIAMTRKGRLWAAWIAGGDDETGFLLVANSDDGGATWTEPRLVVDPTDAPDGLPRRVLVGNLWVDPRGTLWLFYDQSMGFFDGRSGVWALVCDAPDSSEPQWSSPRRLWHGATLNKPLVLGEREWLLPISLWTRDKIGPHERLRDWHRELDPLRMAHVFVSLDAGASWARRGGVTIPRSDYDEHTIVQLRDGRLWMLARTDYGLAESFSHDLGRTWSSPQPSAIRHTNARIHLRRLRSGNLLLVKHGLLDERTPDRSWLRAFVSADDGSSWQGGMVVDARPGVSYPDGVEGPDGTIYIVYDHNRSTDSEILLVRFREDDVRIRTQVDPTQRSVVHKALGSSEHPA